MALNPHATILIFDSVGHGLSARSHNPSDHTVEKRAGTGNSSRGLYGS